MGYESVAHEAEGRMGYRIRGYEGKRNNCFRKIQLVGQKNIETKHLPQVKARHQPFLPPKHYKYAGTFCFYQWAITYSLLVAQPIRMQH